MTLKELMEMLEQANVFKKLIHEMEYRVNIITGETSHGTVQTFSGLVKKLHSIDFMTEEMVHEVLATPVKATDCHRIFKVRYNSYAIKFVIE